MILCFSDLDKLKRATGFLARSRSWTAALKIERSVCTTSRTVPGERVSERSVTHACTSDVRTAESLLPPSRVPASAAPGIICRILATLVSPLLQPSFDGLSAIPHMTAYPIAGWPVALVPPAVQSVNGAAQHFRDIRQRHQLVTGLQRHDHLLSWRRLANPGHWRGRSIQPCLRPDRLAAVHSPMCVSPNIEDLSFDKPLSHKSGRVRS